LTEGSCANAAEAHKRVEVRIHPLLSSQALSRPVEFGLFATEFIRAGTDVTPYGGILRHKIDFAQGDAKTHGRNIPDSDYVLDGLPLANMWNRPTPHSQHQLDALIKQGPEARLPTAASYTHADLERFRASGYGFMSNTDSFFSDGPTLARANVHLKDKSVRVAAGITYKLPMLVASCDIKKDDEIISKYGKQTSPSPDPVYPLHSHEHMKSHLWALFPPTADSEAAAAEWLTWCQQQSADTWEAKRNSWFQLTARESGTSEASELWERGRCAGMSALHLALRGEVYSLVIASQKVLRSLPGEGLQTEHCDAATLKAAEGCYSVLIYLTAGESTDVPVNRSTPQSQNTCWDMRLKDAAEMRHSIPLSTHSVQAGAAMVLSHKVLHRAPRNSTDNDRVVLFQHWIPRRSITVPDSEHQRVPFGV